MTHEDQYRALMAEAARSPSLLGRYELLQEAVRVADEHRDIQLGFEARLAVVWVGAYLACGDAVAVAFSWCLAQQQARPDLFGGRDLLIEYEMVICAVANYDTVSREQMEAMIADYGQRRTEAGHSPGYFWSVTLRTASDLGDRDLSHRAAGELRRLRQDGLLSRGRWFRHANFVGDTDEAMRLAEADILSHGGAAQFNPEWYELPVLLLARGRATDALRWQQRGSAWLGRGSDIGGYSWGFGPLVASLALTGQIEEAVRRFGQCQRMLHAQVDPLTRLHFFIDMGVLFERMHALGTESVWVRLGEGTPPRLPSGRYDVAAIREWMATQASELAARFDRRNGNSHFTDRIRERAGWQAFVGAGR